MVLLSSANGDDVGVWVYCGGVYYGVLLLLWWRFWFIAVMFIVICSGVGVGGVPCSCLW